MKIELHWHNDTRSQLRQWTRILRDQYRNAESLVQVHLDGIGRSLTESKGKPPGSLEVLGIKPSMRCWEFMPGWRLRFAIRLDPEWWFYRIFTTCTLRITILELSREGPP